MPQNLIDEKSTLVQVMAWCHQATSHYLSQFWPRSMVSLGHNVLNRLTSISLLSHKITTNKYYFYFLDQDIRDKLRQTAGTPLMEISPTHHCSLETQYTSLIFFMMRLNNGLSQTLHQAITIVGELLFHHMYENSTLGTKWFVHQENATGAFIVHHANAAGAFIVHQGNVLEHFGSYIKVERSSPKVITVQP